LSSTLRGFCRSVRAVCRIFNFTVSSELFSTCKTPKCHVSVNNSLSTRIYSQQKLARASLCAAFTVHHANTTHQTKCNDE
jgi:hypothetical protein